MGRAESDRDPRLITLTLDLGEPAHRERSSQEISRTVAEAGRALVPTLRTRTSGGAGGGGQPLQLRVFANDLAVLSQAGGQVESALSALPQLADVTNSLAVGPEATVNVDPARLRDLGLTAQGVSTLVRVSLEGVVVGRWTEPNGQERDVRVGLPPAVRSNRETLGSLPLVQCQGAPVVLRQVAGVPIEQKPTKITRVNRQRAATIGAEPNGVPLGTATEAATTTAGTLALPGGAYWELAGTAQEQQDSFQQLGLGLLASVLLMFMILAILYENWLQPLLIQTALPLATVGAFLGLLVFGQTLSLPSFIGLIALFGLVGKNAILLVDRANHLRHEGLDRTAALQEAGESRPRPILMTSAVLVGGMTTSTLLSLVYVPVAYTYFDSFGAWLTLRKREPELPCWRGPVQQVVEGRRTRGGAPAAAVD